MKVSRHIFKPKNLLLLLFLLTCLPIEAQANVLSTQPQGLYDGNSAFFSNYNNVFFISYSMVVLAPDLFNQTSISIPLGTEPDSAIFTLQLKSIPRMNHQAVLFPWTAPPLDLTRAVELESSWLSIEHQNPHLPQVSLLFIAEGSTWGMMRRFLQNTHELFFN